MIEKGILIEPLPITIATLLVVSISVTDWYSWIVLCISTLIATSSLALRRYWRMSALGKQLQENFDKVRDQVEEWRSNIDDANSLSIDTDDDEAIDDSSAIDDTKRHSPISSSNLISKTHALRLLTYNLYLRPPLINSNGNDWKDERLDQFILSVLPNYDIIALQEVFALGSSRQRRLILAAKHLGYNYIVKSVAPPFITSLKFIDAGLLILSRYPVLEASGHIYKTGNQIDHYAAKQVIHARIKINEGTHLNVFTTHTQASYYENSADVNATNDHARLTQVEELCQFVKQKVHNVPDNANNPVVIMGDLNLNARSSPQDGINKGPEYNILEQIFEKYFETSVMNDSKISNYVVRDLIYEGYNGDHPVTYGDAREENGKLVHIQEPVLTNSADWGCRLAIDYIFLLTKRDTPKCRVIPESTKVEKFEVEMAKFPFFQLSDHYAVETKLIVE